MSEEEDLKGCLKVALFLIVLGGSIYLVNEYVAPWVRTVTAFRDAKKTDTANAYYDFMTRYKTDRRSVEAARRAEAIFDRDGQLLKWVRFLTLLGENASPRPLPILTRYLDFPVARVRLAAADALIQLVSTNAQEVRQSLALRREAVALLAEDLDPRLRGHGRCLIWLLDATDPRLAEPDPSSYAEESFLTCRTNLEPLVAGPLASAAPPKAQE